MVDWSIAAVAFLAGSALAWWLRAFAATADTRGFRARVTDLEGQLRDERGELEGVEPVERKARMVQAPELISIAAAPNVIADSATSRS